MSATPPRSCRPRGRTPLASRSSPPPAEQYEVGVKYRPTWFNGLFTLAVYDLTKENVLTPDPEQRPVRDQAGGRGPVARHRARGERQPRRRPQPDPGLRLQRRRGDQGQPRRRRPRRRRATARSWHPRTWPQPGSTTPSRPAGSKACCWAGACAMSAPATPTRPTASRTTPTRWSTRPSATISATSTTRLRGASFGLNANNLLDKEYFTCFSLVDCNWGPGRTVFATLGLRW